MIFRQLLDPETSTWTYLVADPESREALLIDPVREQLERDVELLRELELRLAIAAETHVHADHVTAGGLLRERLGCGVAVGVRSGVRTADRLLADGERLAVGSLELEVRETPGHTAGCITYVLGSHAMAFTGDALLIRGCGRTDFQGGDARTLHTSVRSRILSLPAETLLYPGHDYRGRTVTSVVEERRFNPRLGDAVDPEAFVRIMAGLGLPPPRRMDEAVPANMCSGVTAPEPAAPSSLAQDRWAPLERTRSGVPVLEPAWLASHPEAARIVDVREHVEFCGPLGHIADAELVPLAGLMETARDWDREQPLVTVCAYGTRSGKAARMLAEAGFRRVASLHGGMARWGEEGLPRVEVLGDRLRQDTTPAWQGADI